LVTPEGLTVTPLVDLCFQMGRSKNTLRSFIANNKIPTVVLACASARGKGRVMEQVCVPLEHRKKLLDIGAVAARFFFRHRRTPRRATLIRKAKTRTHEVRGSVLTARAEQEGQERLPLEPRTVETPRQSIEAANTEVMEAIKATLQSLGITHAVYDGETNRFKVKIVKAHDAEF
jgi:hypothetical protein